MRPAFFLVCGLLLTGALPASSAGPALVKDVNPDVAPLNDNTPALSQFVSVGPRAVFVLSRRGPTDYGGELWASDGTDGGTGRLRSFVPSQSQLQVLGSDGRLAFVLVTTPISFSSLTLAVWRTDGTIDGTFPVTGPLLPVPGGFQSRLALGRLFFSGCTAESGCEPWVSDGSAAGTRRLRDLTPGSYGSNPRSFVEMGGRVYFFADTPAGPGLWRTDGTRPGTRRMAPLSPYANPKDLTSSGDRLYFRVGPVISPSRDALWTSDGTAAGTRSLPPFDRARGRGPAVTQFVGAAGGLEYFVGIDPSLGWQIYRTDGTPGGTIRLTKLPGEPFYLGPAASLPDRFVFVGPTVGLWVSDGSRDGTGPLTGCPGGCGIPHAASGMVASGGLVFYNGRLASPGGAGYEPWVTDGTPAGTRQVADVCPGSCDSFPYFGPVIHGQVLFYARSALWGTDGTPGGTRLLAVNAIQAPDLTTRLVAAAGSRLVFAGFENAPTGNDLLPVLGSTEGTPESQLTLDLRLNDGAGSNPREFTALGDKVLFFACSPLGRIWATRGTPESTVPLTDAGGYCDDTTLHFVVLNGIAYFKAFRPGEYWNELWRTDGTPEGTFAISHLGPEQDVTALAVFQGRLVFVTGYLDPDATQVHSGLWTSDGTAAGTAQVFDFGVRYVRELHPVGDAIYFTGQDRDYVTAVFRTDGTQAGTRELNRIQLDAQATDFQQLGGRVFFRVRDFANGDLWRTDGTPEGTVQLEPPGNRVAYVQDLVQLGGRLYFVGLDVTDPSTDQGVPTLFRSDGTVAGTTRVKTFGLEDSSLIPYFPVPWLTAADGSLYFVAADEAHGPELWKSDGTTAGTVLVKDIGPGPESSRISEVTAVGSRIFFAADDGEHGIELWTSDGSDAGTRRVADISEGPTSSAPRELAPIGNRLFFSADDGVVGREPWVLPLDATLSGRIVP